MIRDWGLWELTDEDWHGFVPVCESQKQQENAEKTLRGEESLAPDAEKKASDRSTLLKEEGELESVISPSIQPPTVQVDNFKADDLEENIEKNPLSTSDRSVSASIPPPPVQKEENLEPIRVSSPKIPQAPKINLKINREEARSKTFVQAPTPPTPVQPSQETEFETVEANEEEIAPPIPVTASPQEPETIKPSKPDSTQQSASLTALKIGDLKVTAEEIVPLLEKYQLLPRLVREIIIDRALISVECSSEELTQAIEGFYQQQKVNSPQQLQAWLRQKQFTIEQVQNAIARGIKLEKFKEKMWGDRMESYFLEQKLEFDKVLYSLLRTQDLGVAQELYFRILEEEAEFAPLAKEYSQGVEAKTGGIVGPISLSKIHPTLKEMFQRSKPGQLWSPQYIDNWFVVVRLEQFVPAKLDEEVRQKLLDERFNQWLQEQYQQVVFQ